MSILGGSFFPALNLYNSLRVKNKNHFFFWFMMATTYINLISRKHTTKRNTSVNQAMAFFEQYKKFRFEQLSSNSKNSEEIGRAHV